MPLGKKQLEDLDNLSNESERTTWSFLQAGLDVQTSAIASLYCGSGWTEFSWAFSCYVVLSNLDWASVAGWTINIALPAQNPVRWQPHWMTNPNIHIA